MGKETRKGVQPGEGLISQTSLGHCTCSGNHPAEGAGTTIRSHSQIAGAQGNISSRCATTGERANRHIEVIQVECGPHQVGHRYRRLIPKGSG